MWIIKFRKPVITRQIALQTRGCFVTSSGNVTYEIIKEYIKNQDLQERSKTDNFEIS